MMFLIVTIIILIGCNGEEFIAPIILVSPDWEQIKANSTFFVPDISYAKPYIQSINVGGWEDGLYISRDGLNLYAYFMPVDVFSLYAEWTKNPANFSWKPYYRPPMLDVDMVSNPWGHDDFFQGDIIIATRNNINSSFTQWTASNLKRSISNEGAPCGVLKDANTYDVFVFTQNRNDIEDMDIMFMRNVSTNPNYETTIPIVSTTGVEDNPHIERLNNSTLLLFFDRDRFIYYSVSTDNGNNWNTPVKVTKVLNDQAPYDVQPHLWNDGTDWWVYYSRDNEAGVRCIYKSRQTTPDDWDSWGTPELVIAPSKITGKYGTIIGVGEPSLTTQGDISFVVIYGDLDSEDKTDVFDCDPWFLPIK